MDNLPRVRTLPEAAKELAIADPGTRLTLPVLRRLVATGVVPVVYSGRRALVDMTRLGAHLEASAQLPGTTESNASMRPVSEAGVRR